MKNIPITERLSAPDPEQVRHAREVAGITQKDAGLLVSGAQSKPHIVWQSYEAPENATNHRKMPLASWELFLLLTNQHPHFLLKNRDKHGE